MSTNIVENAQVIVVGGGSAGLNAAIAASRNGANTLLVEQYGFPGGTLAMANVGPLAPFHFKDKQVIKGIPQEIVDRLIANNAATGHLKAVPEYGSGSYMCYFDREVYKYVVLEMLEEAGCRLLLHSHFSDVIMDGKSVKGIIVDNKSGRQRLQSDVVIDASGDADVAARAGVDFEVGRKKDGLTEAMTLIFEVANVDEDKLWKYVHGNPSEFEWASALQPASVTPANFRRQYYVAQGFLSLVKQAVKEKELHIGRNSLLFQSSLRPGVLIFNSTRVCGAKGIDSQELTSAEIDSRKQVFSIMGLLQKHVPGFEQAYVLSTGPQIGVRETRRIIGEYYLTGEDVLQGRKFPDGIAGGYFAIDIHSEESGLGYTNKEGGSVWKDLSDSYTIPYRCLIPAEIENLLVTGRCISASHEAQGSCRSTGTCMATGQAAGTAAALAIKQSITPREVKAKNLRAKLMEQGVHLE